MNPLYGMRDGISTPVSKDHTFVWTSQKYKLPLRIRNTTLQIILTNPVGKIPMDSSLAHKVVPGRVNDSTDPGQLSFEVFIDAFY
jgi:hypothetical protein